MIKKNTFSIYSPDIAKKNNIKSHYLKRGIYSAYQAEKIEDSFIFFVGIIYNLKDLKKKSDIKDEKEERIIFKLYKKYKNNITDIFDGAYSIVIIDDYEITLFRDRDGLENLYYYKKNNSFIISNFIKEIKKFINLEVNVQALPKYFILDQINNEQTFFKNINKLKIFELLKYNYHNNTWLSSCYNNIAFLPQSEKSLNDKEIINQIENILTKKVGYIIKTFPHSNIYNTLSGGVDSSLTQGILKNFGYNKSYCSNLMNYGKDDEYSSDIANYLGSSHQIIQVNFDDLLKNIEEGIKIAEIPLIFEGESMFNHMYKKIAQNNDRTSPTITCFNSNGADAVLGHGKTLMAIKYLNIAPHFFYFFNEYAVKLLSEKKYSILKQILNGIKINEIFPALYFAVFDVNDRLEVIKKAFKLSDLSFIPEFEIAEANRYNVNLLEKFYRLQIFHNEVRRINNIDYQLAKSKNITLIFLFRDKKLIQFLLNIPTGKKLKYMTDKYYGKKLLTKFIPKKFVYREKFNKRIPYQYIFKHDKNFISLIQDIKKSQYNYFDFDYNQIFFSKGFERIAIKLINFHIWHRLFIENN